MKEKERETQRLHTSCWKKSRELKKEKTEPCEPVHIRVQINRRTDRPFSSSFLPTNRVKFRFFLLFSIALPSFVSSSFLLKILLSFCSDRLTDRNKTKRLTGCSLSCVFLFMCVPVECACVPPFTSLSLLPTSLCTSFTHLTAPCNTQNDRKERKEKFRPQSKACLWAPKRLREEWLRKGARKKK